MPIRFRCRHCDTRIKVPDGSEGANVRCPSCNERQRVPVASPPEAPPEASPEAPQEDVQESPEQATAQTPGETLEPSQQKDAGEVVDEASGVDASSEDSADALATMMAEAGDDEIHEHDSDSEEDETGDWTDQEETQFARDDVAEQEDEPREPDETPETSDEDDDDTGGHSRAAAGRPQPSPRPMVDAAAGSDAGQSSGERRQTQNAERSSTRTTPRRKSGQPRVIATSSRPTEHRQAARAVPLSGSASGLQSSGMVGTPTADTDQLMTGTKRRPVPPMSTLVVLTWVLRVWAGLLLVVAVKDVLVLLTGESTLSAVEKMLEMIRAMTWPIASFAIAELSWAVRTLVRQTWRG